MPSHRRVRKPRPPPRKGSSAYDGFDGLTLPPEGSTTPRVFDWAAAPVYNPQGSHLIKPADSAPQSVLPMTQKPSTTFLTALLVLSILGTANIVFATNDPGPTGGEVIGDWEVTGAKSYTDVEIILGGNLNVTPTGSLTLDGVHLVMNSSGPQRIIVSSGGELTIKGDSVIEVGPGGSTYDLAAREGSSLTIDGATINDMWFFMMPGVLMNEGQGIWVNTPDSSINGLTVTSSTRGVGFGPVPGTIQNSFFIDINTAVTALGPLTIRDSTFNDNSRSIDLLGFGPTLISGNTFNGFNEAIRSSQGMATLSNNIFSGGNQGILLDQGTTTTIQGNSLSNLGGGVYLNGGEVTSQDNSFSGINLALLTDNGGRLASTNDEISNAQGGIVDMGRSSVTTDGSFFRTSDTAIDVRGLSSATLKGGLFQGSTAISCAEFSTLAVQDTTIVPSGDFGNGPGLGLQSGCSATASGILVQAGGALADIQGNSFLRISASQSIGTDSGLIVGPGTVVATDVTITQTSEFGVLFDGGRGTLTGLTLDGTDGGLLFQSLGAGSTTIDGLTIDSFGTSPLIVNEGPAPVTIDNLNGNTLASICLDLWGGGGLTLRSSVLTCGSGIAQSSESPLTIIDSSVSTASGGGLLANNGAVVLVRDSTVSLNAGLFPAGFQDGTNLISFDNVDFGGVRDASNPWGEPSNSFDVRQNVLLGGTWQNGVPIPDLSVTLRGDDSGALLFSANSGPTGIVSHSQHIFSANGVDDPVYDESSYTFGATFSGTTVERSALPDTRDFDGTVVFTDDVVPDLVLFTPTQDLVSNGPVEFLGESSDLLSGIDHVSWSSDGGMSWNPTNASPEFSFTIPDPGTETTLEVQVRASDVAGNSVEQTRIITFDHILPMIDIDTPVDGLTNDVPVLIAGTTDGNEVTVDGLAAVVEGGRFSITLNLTEGQHLVTAESTDAAGNLGLSALNVTVDLTAPALALDGGANRLVPSVEAVLISGMTDTGSIVTVSGPAGAIDPLIVGTDGLFNATVTVHEGENLITVTATDGAGNAATATQTITRDSIDPSLSLDQEIPGVTNANNLTISGSTDQSRVTINGVQVNATNGSFIQTMDLPEGLVTITIVVTDAAGNTVTLTRQILVDRTAPVLQILSPADDVLTRADRIDVAGIVHGQNIVTVVGLPVTPQIDGTFSVSITLREGENQIIALAADGAGNMARADLLVTRDTIAPTFDLDPLPSTTDGQRATFRGRVSEPVATLTVDGEAVNVSNNLTFEATIELRLGHNGVLVAATDAAGNTGSTEVDLKRELAAGAEGSVTTPSLMMFIVLGLLVGLLIALLLKRGRPPTASAAPAGGAEVRGGAARNGPSTRMSRLARPRMGWVGSLALVALLLVSPLASFPALALNDPPVSGGVVTGDWIVENTFTSDPGAFFQVDGDLIISDGGHLTLQAGASIDLYGDLTIEDGGTLTTVSAALFWQDFGQRLVVEDGGTAEFTSSVSDVGFWGFGWTFRADPGSTLTVTSSRFDHIGIDTADWCEYGFCIRTDDVTIDGLFLNNPNGGGLQIDGATITAEDVEVYDPSGNAFHIEDSTVTLTNSTFNCASGWNNLENMIFDSDVTFTDTQLTQLYDIDATNSDILVINGEWSNNLGDWEFEGAPGRSFVMDRTDVNNGYGDPTWPDYFVSLQNYEDVRLDDMLIQNNVNSFDFSHTTATVTGGDVIGSANNYQFGITGGSDVTFDQVVGLSSDQLFNVYDFGDGSQNTVTIDGLQASGAITSILVANGDGDRITIRDSTITGPFNDPSSPPVILISGQGTSSVEIDGLDMSHLAGGIFLGGFQTGRIVNSNFLDLNSGRTDDQDLASINGEDGGDLLIQNVSIDADAHHAVFAVDVTNVTLQDATLTNNSQRAGGSYARWLNGCFCAEVVMEDVTQARINNIDITAADVGVYLQDGVVASASDVSIEGYWDEGFRSVNMDELTVDGMTIDAGRGRGASFINGRATVTDLTIDSPMNEGVFLQNLQGPTLTNLQVTARDRGLWFDGLPSMTTIDDSSIESDVGESAAVWQSRVIAHDTDFISNNLVGLTLRTDSYAELHGGSIVAPNGFDVLLEDDDAWVQLIGTTWTDSDLNQSMSCCAGATSGVILGHEVDITVEFPDGTPVPGAAVAAVDTRGILVSGGVTDGTGKVLDLAAPSKIYLDDWLFGGIRTQTVSPIDFTATLGEVSATVSRDPAATPSVTIVLPDDTPPQVEIVSLLETGAALNLTGLVSGTSNDSFGNVVLVQISIDEEQSWQPTEGSVGSWFTNLTFPGEGLFNVTAMATDTGGNEVTESRSILIDHSGPAIFVDLPEDTLYSNAAVLRVDGMIEADATEFTLDGVSLGESDTAFCPPAPCWTADPNGTLGGMLGFSIPLRLSEGEHLLSFEAVDGVGNHNLLTRTLVIDRTAPVIMPDLDDGAMAISDLVISGTTDGVTLTVDGLNATIENGSFSLEVHLTDGSHELNLTATDMAGNVGTEFLNLVIDTVLPRLNVSGPLALGNLSLPLLSNASVPVHVTSELGDPVSIFIDAGLAISIPLDNNDTGTFGLLEADGLHHVRIVAIDMVGNSAAFERDVVFDLTAPRLTVMSPSDGLATRQAAVRVAGVTEPGVLLTVNGHNVTVDALNGTFVDSASVPEGVSDIVVVATDAAGNSASWRVSILSDRTGPAITIDAPAKTSKDKVKVTVTVDDASATLWFRGQEVNLTGGSAEVVVELREGDNNLSFSASDPVGNVGTKQTTIKRTAGENLGFASSALGAWLFFLLFIVIGAAIGFVVRSMGNRPKGPAPAPAPAAAPSTTPAPERIVPVTKEKPPVPKTEGTGDKDSGEQGEGDHAEPEEFEDFAEEKAPEKIPTPPPAAPIAPAQQPAGAPKATKETGKSSATEQKDEDLDSEIDAILKKV